ncbi:SDR family oxidoreductase [Bosea psychrotolerans]|uniref:Saccharopine dehydrogenase-like NADP-dependent oxidoreductase n=1 Tax=Bosea psychrotolerans TaxID=1871628 RepID=A0A2S4M9J6_9HYPH|nr:SDR family oxidoreductase [Bosea psychrotolerans]POR51412.1 saccharopine dehydrogenase-like NADP-dependent oxidoreductase [Bosea psychrotolerans]
MTTRRVLLIGGTGVFGQRLARHIAGMAGLDLTITSRNEAKARALADSIATAATTTIRGIGLDHRRDLDAVLAKLSPWLVIDASGPFQGASYDVPRAALTAGAHIVDLADARDYILGYGPALDGLACERGLVALAGASSTPALSCAAVAALTEGWRRIDTLDITITPGGRSEVGEAVIAAILSYAGRPIPIWREGELQDAHGWIDGRRVVMPGLGSRRVAAVETVDAQWLGPKLAVRSRVAFQAGLESPIEQFGIGMLARLRKRGWLGDLKPLIPALLAGRKLTRLPTSDRGGMLVEATGLDANGELRTARWSLLAERGDGPHVPTLPAAAALRALLAGQIAPGARPAAGALTLAAIEAEMTPYAISTQSETTRHGEAVFEAALGQAAFKALAAPLKTLHGRDGPPVWHGRSEIETGNGFIAQLLRKIIGLPPAGRDIPLTFSIERIASSSGPAEIWTRNFGGVRFSSRLSTRAGGELWEAFGPLSFGVGLAVAGDGLELPVATMRCLGLPLPSFLQPKSQAREYADAEGRFHFDVKLTLPVIGLLTHYKGWLVPAGGADEARPESAPAASHPAG